MGGAEDLKITVQPDKQLMLISVLRLCATLVRVLLNCGALPRKFFVFSVNGRNSMKKYTEPC